MRRSSEARRHPFRPHIVPRQSEVGIGTAYTACADGDVTLMSGSSLAWRERRTSAGTSGPHRQGQHPPDDADSCCSVDQAQTRLPFLQHRERVCNGQPLVLVGCSSFDAEGIALLFAGYLGYPPSCGGRTTHPDGSPLCRGRAPSLSASRPRRPPHPSRAQSCVRPCDDMPTGVHTRLSFARIVVGSFVIWPDCKHRGHSDPNGQSCHTYICTPAMPESALSYLEESEGASGRRMSSAPGMGLKVGLCCGLPWFLTRPPRRPRLRVLRVGPRMKTHTQNALQRRGVPTWCRSLDLPQTLADLWQYAGDVRNAGCAQHMHLAAHWSLIPSLIRSS